MAGGRPRGAANFFFLKTPEKETQIIGRKYPVDLFVVFFFGGGMVSEKNKLTRK